VEVINLVDKKRLMARSYHDKEGKESLNFAFPFHVPDGSMVMDLPLGAAAIDKDQMPSACKNWLTVGRWVDVANKQHGVTWVTLDAPLVEVGYLSANLLNSQTNPDVWRKRIEKSQRLYSWAMNNHWGTNYRAYQDGPTVFRFILRPHRGKTDPAEATRFSTGFSQPLLATRAGRQPTAKPLLTLSSPDVVVVGLKPSDDQKAVIVRLFGASGEDRKVKLDWGSTQPKSVHLSDTSERPGSSIGKQVAVPGYGLITLRAEL
jgi:alpha-mannosidase